MEGTQHNDKIQDKSCISIPLASAQMQLPMSGSTHSTSMVKGVSVTAINATENNKIHVNV